MRFGHRVVVQAVHCVGHAAFVARQNQAVQHGVAVAHFQDDHFGIVGRFERRNRLFRQIIRIMHRQTYFRGRQSSLHPNGQHAGQYSFQTHFQYSPNKKTDSQPPIGTENRFEGAFAPNRPSFLRQYYLQQVHGYYLSRYFSSTPTKTSDYSGTIVRVLQNLIAIENNPMKIFPKKFADGGFDRRSVSRIMPVFRVVSSVGRAADF